MRYQHLISIFLVSNFLWSGWNIPLASAQSKNPEPRTAALVLAREGARFYNQGNYQAALEKFIQAHELFPSPKLFFNLGQAYRGLSLHSKALESFEQFLKDVHDDSREYREQATSQVAELNTKVTRIAVACNRSGSTVSIDGVKRGTIPLPKPIYVDPGPHSLKLDWEHNERVIEFTAVAGQIMPFVLTFEESTPSIVETPILVKSEKMTSPLVSAPPTLPSPELPNHHIWYWVGGSAIAVATTVLLLIFVQRERYPTADLGSKPIGE